jgi:AICAR transformylase/IMP cyclohydrolase PurH
MAKKTTKFVKKIDKETKHFKVDMNKGYQGYVSTYDDDCFANMAIDGHTMHLPAPKNIEKIAIEMYDMDNNISKIGSKISELERIALDPDIKKKIKLLAGKYTSEYDDLGDIIAKITDTLL